jgi:hypothetical protein
MGRKRLKTAILWRIRDRMLPFFAAVTISIPAFHLAAPRRGIRECDSSSAVPEKADSDILKTGCFAARHLGTNKIGAGHREGHDAPLPTRAVRWRDPCHERSWLHASFLICVSALSVAQCNHAERPSWSRGGIKFLFRKDSESCLVFEINSEPAVHRALSRQRADKCNVIQNLVQKVRARVMAGISFELTHIYPIFL